MILIVIDLNESFKALISLLLMPFLAGDKGAGNGGGNFRVKFVLCKSLQLFILFLEPYLINQNMYCFTLPPQLSLHFKETKYLSHHNSLNVFLFSL